MGAVRTQASTKDALCAREPLDRLLRIDEGVESDPARTWFSLRLQHLLTHLNQFADPRRNAHINRVSHHFKWVSLTLAIIWPQCDSGNIETTSAGGSGAWPCSASARVMQLSVSPWHDISLTSPLAG
jgi:hypothetical protein